MLVPFAFFIWLPETGIFCVGMLEVLTLIRNGIL